MRSVEMEIRKAVIDDLDEIMDIYAHARSYMAETGNPNQWGDGYPSGALVRRDIEQGISYVAVQDGQIEAVFVYFAGEDLAYRVIEDGSWLNDMPYGVIHRIASRGNVKGVGSFCMKWGFAQCGNLKMDTHDDNVVMQHVLEKNGFRRCGRIFLEDGSPRIAYQKTEE